jgi:hypothetical protein
MRRFATACLAACCLAALAVPGIAADKAEKKAAEKVCALGKGRAVCCKAYVADHCVYVACCEVGNAGFFSKTHCAACEKNAAKASPSGAAATGCGAGAPQGYVACCEVGNAGFFKGKACGACAAAKSASCCSAGK